MKQKALAAALDEALLTTAEMKANAPGFWYDGGAEAVAAAAAHADHLDRRTGRTSLELKELALLIRADQLVREGGLISPRSA